MATWQEKTCQNCDRIQRIAADGKWSSKCKICRYNPECGISEYDSHWFGTVTEAVNFPSRPRETLPYVGTVPTYAHDGDAGADVGAAVDVLLPHGSFVAVPTGTRVAIPRGFVGLICPRSGLAARHGVTVLNAPGIIDSGFRDEIKVVLINHGSQSFQLHAGDRIAQILIMPIAYATFVSVDILDATERGDGGFGSTGV